MLARSTYVCRSAEELFVRQIKPSRRRGGGIISHQTPRIIMGVYSFSWRPRCCAFASSAARSSEAKTILFANNEQNAPDSDFTEPKSSSSSSSSLNNMTTTTTTTSPRPSRNNNNLFRLAELSRQEWKLVAMSAATLGVTSSVTLLLPYASGQVIDYTIQSGAGNDALSPIVLAGGLFGLSALAGGGVYLRTLWLACAGNRIVARLKQRLYASILYQDRAFLDKQSTGDLLSRLTADAALVEYAVTTDAVSALRGVVMTIGSASMLIYTSPTLALISCGTLPPIFILSRYVGRKLEKEQEVVQELEGAATSLAEQAVSAINTVKQFTAEDFEVLRYQRAIAKAHRKAVDTARLQAQLEATTHIAGNAGVLCVLGYGGSMVVAGSISAGDLTGFVMYSLLLAGNLSGLTSLYGDMIRAVAASNRVIDILDRVPQIKPSSNVLEDHHHKNPDPLIPIEYKSPPWDHSIKEPLTIEIANLNFRYPSRSDVDVLSNFNLSIEAGEVVAIVGGSGSGKSTIANILTRLYDVPTDEGSILINGKAIQDYDPFELRRMIGIVSQEPTLFDGSIKDNIAYGEWKNITDKQIEEAARLARVLDFADDFPFGLDTMVGPRGAMLSGGQRQRIAIARVLAKNPHLVILDEATSALDAQSEHLVQLAMNSIFEEKGRTVISIAHRLSTIRHADRIAVLQDGSVVQTGTFEDLSLEEGPFRELMRTQLVGDI